MKTPQQSAADCFLALPLAERKARLATLTNDEVARLRYDWAFWARPDQLLPEGDWQTWLILAGRGYGKTRTGAETVRLWARSFRYVNIIAPTADDARDIMIEGESGILAICPRHERPYYRTSKSRLEWPNGARSLILTADEPDRIRGKQHEKLWADELAAWRYAESWDQAMFGLRLGSNPQAIVTTTPKPTKIVKDLIADPTTLVTRGTSYANRSNLSPAFYAKIIRKYEGTRLGRQELNAEILDDNPRALWNRGMIERGRIKVAPVALHRIVVGLDPNVKNRDRAVLAKAPSDTLDEAGIVIAGCAPDDKGAMHFYVLDDRSLDEGPDAWGRAAVKAYSDHSADRIIGEVNNGGDMVEMTIRAVDRNVSYRSVTASRGKAIRAEPISALYEQGRVHHVGCFAQLEDEMCQFDPITTNKSPNRMDALVWALTELSADEGFGLLHFYADVAAAAKQQDNTLPFAEPTTVTGFPT